ncbi:MAG TPA: phage portal protein, partial [Chryseolinea sp.]|nr:phage portal protein [Chryseolinea sp.]
AFSGVALDTFFLDPEIKAIKNRGIFGESLQRRVNLMRVSLVVFDPSLKPSLLLKIAIRFRSFLPKNVGELVDLLIKLTGGGLMSKDTAVRQNPLVKDANAELIALEKQKEDALAEQVVLGPPIGQNPPKNQPQPTK